MCGRPEVYAAAAVLLTSALAVGDPPASNTALQFNGINSYVTMGVAPGLGLSAFTLEAWCKRTGAGQITSSGRNGVLGVPLICKGANEGERTNTDVNYMLVLRSPDYVLAADFEDTATGVNYPVVGGTPLALDTWYHVAATCDGAAWRLYLNGRLEVEMAITTAPRADSIQHFGLGSALNSTGVRSGFFAGVLDEVRVWNYARSAAQIAAAINGEVAAVPGLVGRWGLNEGIGNVAGDSSGAGVNGTIVNAAWAAGAPFNINFPPLPPTLVGPADSSRIRGTRARLAVQTADPESDAIQTRFFGRMTGGFSSKPFRIVALPDTQYYSASYPDIFRAQTQWIVDNRDALNIVYVAHLGDLVDSSGIAAQWVNANAAISILDAAPDLPLGLCVGNHDQDSNYAASAFNAWFPFTRYESRPWYGGHYGADNDNHVVLFGAAGMRFVAVHLEYGAGSQAAVLAWAGQVLATHADRQAIVVCHDLINVGTPGPFSSNGTAIYNALKTYPNLFLMLCGHNHGESRRTDLYNGRTVHTLLSDYQGRSNGGDGWLRIMEFRPADDQIVVKTYSPTRGYYETDADSAFTIDCETSLATFTELGALAGPPGEVSLDWTGLVPGESYEWYAAVSDGGATVRGETWSFDSVRTPGDLDGDADVDEADYQAFVACFTGTGNPIGAGCLVADLNADSSVDGIDYGVFASCFNGAGNPPACQQ